MVVDSDCQKVARNMEMMLTVPLVNTDGGSRDEVVMVECPSYCVANAALVHSD